MSAEPEVPETTEAKEASGKTGFLVDFGPLLAFAVAYKLGGIYWATGTFMVMAPVALVVAWVRERKFRPMPAVTAAIVLVFGGLTIWFGDPRFIYLKPTIVTGLIGLTLLGGLVFGKALLEPLLGAALPMHADGWRALTLRYGLFSLLLAALNEAVWRNVAEHYWVWFKFAGIPALTLVFFATQLPLLARYRTEPET